MKKWTWVLLFVGAAALLMWITRENFDNYAAALAAVGQTTGYTNTNAPAGTPNTGVGTAGTATPATTAASTPAGTGTGASGATAGMTPCQTEIATKQWSEVSAACKASAGGAGTGGNTTGGSSTTPGSNSGGMAAGSDQKGNIWGPAFTGFGDNAGDGSGNSKRDYPTLLGPEPKASVFVEGAGIADISQAEKLKKSGALPGAKNTGSDPNSQFFGSSRTPAGASTTPGDKDLFPNPYQEFTASTGSSKTEPVPYLSDFSAFAK